MIVEKAIPKLMFELLENTEGIFINWRQVFFLSLSLPLLPRISLALKFIDAYDSVALFV